MASVLTVPLDAEQPYCSIERALRVVGERWSMLILRDSLLYGRTRFADFQSSLGIATNVLTDRLDALVEAGVFERRQYRESGSRARWSYHPTPAGEQLRLVLGAIQQWGDANVPRADGPTVLRRSISEDRPAHVAFVDDRGIPLDLEDVAMELRPEYARG